MTNSYIYFLIFTSYLHSLHILQEGKRVTIDEEKTAVCFGVFFNHRVYIHVKDFVHDCL